MENKRVLLMILDGWGLGREDNSNAIFTQGEPNIDKLKREYPHSQLLACGEDVGLPHGQMGNSEVGHLNIGAGRVVYQDLVKINKVCQEGKLMENTEIASVMEYLKKDKSKSLHLLGLVSAGGVHSSLQHLFALLDTAALNGLSNVYIHCFMDGRDTDPHSGVGYVKELEEHLKKTTGKIASVCGRFYAMDRDKRWDRIKEAYDLIVHGRGAQFNSAVDGIESSYKQGVTDEFIKPIVIVDGGNPVATLKPDDAVIFFNFRNDRARELTSVLTQKDMPENQMHTMPLYYCCLTPYDDDFKGLHILFNKEHVQDTIGEVVAKAGKKQLRIAETEKYAHVTFFFSGGREEPFENEERILVASPKVATYDLKPEMSAPEVAEKLLEAIRTQKNDMIILNFANGDMVGHTGVYEAIKRAVKTVDTLVGEIVEEARKNGYSVIITADHGNADYALNEDGSPNTQHSLNPVQFIVIDDDVESVENGRLCDIAPTMLSLMGLEKPEDMTGRDLLTYKKRNS